MERGRADLIAESLEEEILDGTFPTGAHLDEVRLAERYGVSRTPLREAFQRLAASGLIEHIPNRGVFVRAPSAVEIMEMFEVMSELEAACGRFAASRITEESLARLKMANAACRASLSDSDAYYRENETFHSIIYGACGNAFLEQETALLHRRLRPFRRIQLRLRGRIEQSLAEHEAIVDALAKGNGEAAAAELRSHVAVQGEKFHRLISSLKTAAE